MRKYAIYVLVLSLLLVGCAAPGPVEEPVPLQEAPVTVPQETVSAVPENPPAAPERVPAAPAEGASVETTSAQPAPPVQEFRVEGMQEQVAVTVYQGQGYTISIPDSGWRLERDVDDGVFEDTWESTVSDDVELQVSRYEGKTAAAARDAFVRDHDDYRFDDLTGDLVTGSERDGDVLVFFTRETGGTTYLVSWQYPAYAAEGFGSRLRQIADTFQLTN